VEGLEKDQKIQQLSSDLAALQEVSESAQLIPQLKAELETHEASILKLSQQLEAQTRATRVLEEEVQSRDAMISELHEERASSQMMRATLMTEVSGSHIALERAQSEHESLVKEMEIKNITQREELSVKDEQLRVLSEECERMNQQIQVLEAQKVSWEEESASVSVGPSSGDGPVEKTESAGPSSSDVLEASGPSSGDSLNQREEVKEMTSEHELETDSRVAALESELSTQERRIAELEAKLLAQQQELEIATAAVVVAAGVGVAAVSQMQPKEELLLPASTPLPPALTQPNDIESPEQPTASDPTAASQPSQAPTNEPSADQPHNEVAVVEQLSASAAVNEPPPSTSTTTEGTTLVPLSPLAADVTVTVECQVPTPPPPLALPSSVETNMEGKQRDGDDESLRETILLLRAELSSSELRSQRLLKSMADLLRYVRREMDCFHREAMEIQNEFFVSLEAQQSEVDEEATKTRLQLLVVEEENRRGGGAAAPGQQQESWLRRLFSRKA
jgi:hypothetical protein